MPINGGCTFAEHPDRAVPDARVIWRADFDPGTLKVVAVPARRTRSADRFDPKRVRAWLAIARDRDGNEHAVLSDGLFGEERVRLDWRGESDSLRSRVRRLVRDARTMAKGGYLGLLSGDRAQREGERHDQFDLDFGE